jgi:hypothetical protein
LIDGTVRTQLPSGVVEYTSDGNVGRILGVALFALAIACAGMAFFSPRTKETTATRFSGLFFLLIGWWVLCSAVLRLDAVDRQQLPFIIGATVISLGVAYAPPTLRTLSSFNGLRDVTAVLVLVVSAVDPANSQLACREDKCGVFGSLYVGFFYTENAAAMFIVLLLPALITVASRTRLFFSLSVATLALWATGSRTSLLDLAVVCIFVLWYRRSVLERRKRTIPWFWRVVPAIAFAASLFTFLTFSGDELTGRGWIFAGIREELRGYSLLVGSGPDTMERLFQVRSVTFEAVGEHGLVPHYAVQAGLVGLVIFAIAMAVLAFDSRPWSPGQVGAFGLLLAASLQSVTEPGWMLSSRTINFAVLLLAIGLFRRDPPSAEDPHEATPADLTPGRPQFRWPLPRGERHPERSRGEGLDRDRPARHAAGSADNGSRMVPRAGDARVEDAEPGRTPVGG